MQGVFLLINPTPPAFIEFLFSRPTFCSIFFLFIIFCHYCKCLRACVCGWLFLRARRVCLCGMAGLLCLCASSPSPPTMTSTRSSSSASPHNYMPEPSTFSRARACVSVVIFHLGFHGRRLCFSIFYFFFLTLFLASYTLLKHTVASKAF